MSKLHFINKRSKDFHNVLTASDTWLLIVACTALPQALMTVKAYEALRLYMDEADRQSAKCIKIMPEAAAALGWTRVWTAHDIRAVFGAGKPPEPGGA
jgi:hypothetical protein